MLATNLFMLVYGVRLVDDHLAPDDRGVPDRLGRRLLPADPDRRRHHVLFVRRAAAAAGGLPEPPADPSAISTEGSADRHGPAHPARQLPGVRLLGVPVAYALGLVGDPGGLWIGIPLEAVMLKISDGTTISALLAIPFFILAGAIMAEGGMAERLVNLAKIFVGFIRGGLALVNILASAFFGCISGSSVADTASIGSVMIPQMIKNGYPRLFAVNVTFAGSLQPLLIPPSHNAVIYSLAAGGTIPIGAAVPGRRRPRVPDRHLADGALPDHRPPGQFPEGRGDRLRQALQDRPRCVLGPADHRHHPRRHPRRHLHADRSRGGGLRLRLPRHHVRLSRLQVERAAAAARPRGAHRRHGHDPDRLLLGLRLHDGDHAGAAPGRRTSSSASRTASTLPAAHQPAAAAARHLHGHGADAADLRRRSSCRSS